jgi:hypothetical protein
VLSVILRFVPYIGPIIAAVLPATLAAAVSPHWSMVVWTLGLFAVTELITGQFIEPLVYGTALTPIENFYQRMLATTWMRLSSRPSCSSGRHDCGDRRANHLARIMRGRLANVA